MADLSILEAVNLLSSFSNPNIKTPITENSFNGSHGSHSPSPSIQLKETENNENLKFRNGGREGMMTESSTTASHTRNKRSKSTQPEGPITNLKNVEIEEEEDELDDGTRPALKNTKRAAQNRAAQRAFRERKESYVRDLERKSLLLDSTLLHERTLIAEVASLNSTIALLQSQSNPPPHEPPSSTKLLESQLKVSREESKQKDMEIIGLRAILEELRRENSVTRSELRR